MKRQEKMKKILSLVIVLAFAFGSVSFAADETAQTAAKAPVAEAAVEVTKDVTQTVEAGVERRATRRQARRETLLGGDKTSKEAKDTTKDITKSAK